VFERIRRVVERALPVAAALAMPLVAVIGDGAKRW